MLANEEKKLTMYQLEKDFLEELEECKSEILEATYPEDLLSEMAESNIPVYNYELLQLVSDDLWLGYPSESGLTEGYEDAYQIIGMNIYERLLDISLQWLEQAREE